MAGVSTKEIKTRIRSMESTRQITKAMEMVASSKLRKAQNQAMASRPYFETLYETIQDIVSCDGEFSSPYMTVKKENKAAILMTNFSDRNELDSKNVKIDITGFTGDGGVKAEYYLLDEKKDLEKVREEIFNGSTFSPILKLEPYASYLIKLEKL